MFRHALKSTVLATPHVVFRFSKNAFFSILSLSAVCVFLSQGALASWGNHDLVATDLPHGFAALDVADWNGQTYLVAVEDRCTASRETAKLCSEGRIPTVELLSQKIEEGVAVEWQTTQDLLGQPAMILSIDLEQGESEPYQVMALLKPVNSSIPILPPKGTREAQCDSIVCHKH